MFVYSAVMPSSSVYTHTLTQSLHMHTHMCIHHTHTHSLHMHTHTLTSHAHTHTHARAHTYTLHIQTSKCAVVLRNTTFQYHMTSLEHSCFKQVSHLSLGICFHGNHWILFSPSRRSFPLYKPNWLLMYTSVCFQLGTFFDLVDEPVLGYEPPSLITELHAHLRECAMEYRYGHMPESLGPPSQTGRKG